MPIIYTYIIVNHAPSHTRMDRSDFNISAPKLYMPIIYLRSINVNICVMRIIITSYNVNCTFYRTLNNNVMGFIDNGKNI
jgi:hypothetical protein